MRFGVLGTGMVGRACVMDLGAVSAARGMEMYLPLWLRLWGATGTGHLNVKVLAGSEGEL